MVREGLVVIGDVVAERQPALDRARTQTRLPSSLIQHHFVRESAHKRRHGSRTHFHRTTLRTTLRLFRIIARRFVPSITLLTLRRRGDGGADGCVKYWLRRRLRRPLRMRL
jgi:hypothetical protein